MSDNTADETGRPYKVAWWQSKDLHRRFYVAANTYMDHLESRIRELETKLRAENRKLREALLDTDTRLENLGYELNTAIRSRILLTLAGQPTSEPEVLERDNKVCADALGLVMENPPTEDEVATWSDEEYEQAIEWSGREHFVASDNDHIERVPMPAFLSPYIARGAKAYVDRLHMDIFYPASTSEPEVCTWTWNERDADGNIDGAFFDTSCGERVSPAPGVQRCCHMCGDSLRVNEEGT